MITYKNNELRNLQEQVLKNKEDIALHYAIDRALANFGIKIVGTVATAADLPDPITYIGEYGDGYAVGTPGNYVYYIFTRPDLNAGITTNYWLNVGAISIVGPQGPQGVQGPQGPAGKGSKWYTNTYPSNPQEGDMFLGSLGDVFQYTNNTWVLITNIQGPQGIQGIQGPQGLRGEQGPQGPQGERGDVGGFINIAGVVENINQLPAPSTLDNLTIAYLIGTAAPYTLYIQVGSTSDTAIWTNVGDLNVATYVTSGGVYQNIWDADTKLNRDINSYGECSLSQGNEIIFYHDYFKTWAKKPVSQNGDSTTGRVIAGASDGQIKQNLAPSADNDLTNKAYVDTKMPKRIGDYVAATGNQLELKVPIAWGGNNNNKIQGFLIARSNGNRYKRDTSIVSTEGGTGAILQDYAPTADNHLTNKQYVDAKTHIFTSKDTLDTDSFLIQNINEFDDFHYAYNFQENHWMYGFEFSAENPARIQTGVTEIVCGGSSPSIALLNISLTDLGDLSYAPAEIRITNASMIEFWFCEYNSGKYHLAIKTNGEVEETWN